MRRRAEVVIPRGMVTSAPANAKERRRLKREAERQQDGAPAAERRKETGESEAEGLRRRDPKTAECDGKETARERRRAKRAAERDDDDDDDDDPKLDARTVKAMKPAQLKDALKKKGLSTQGQKKDLVDRLLNAI